VSQQDDQSTAQDPITPDRGPFRDRSNWTTGNDPITPSQQSTINTLATQAGREAVDTSSMTKSQASECIDELREANDLPPINPAS